MSTFRPALDDYLSLRRKLGHELSDAARLLPRFVDYLEATAAEFVTVDAALCWSQEPQSAPGTTVWPRRMMAVRGFARYMSGIDSRTEVPPVGLLPFRRSWRQPFIYSEADILGLMAQTRRSIPTPFRADTYETLIGLLASTGLRVGEAIRLECKDIDWSDGILFIRQSKFGKSRQVALHESTMDALSVYARTRSRVRPKPRSESFFVSLRGGPLIYETIFQVFRKVQDEAGVGVGSPTSPRIHDLRHSFAVHTLLTWYREGVDVQNRLPWLSTYLGHRDPRSTYLYLSAAPELLGHAAKLLELSQAVAP